MKRHKTLGMMLAALAGMAGALPVHAAAKVKSHTYKGPIETMRWGPVEAIVTITGKKITKAQMAVATETMRSQMIDEQAWPILRQETLQAQSSSIDTVSGATLTSEAYIASLDAVLHKEHFKQK